MDLSEHYNELFKKSSGLIFSENYGIDTKLNAVNDKRFGITLLVRPSDEVKENSRIFINELKKIEPNQYYYPDSDIHVTVMSIILGNEKFTLKQFSTANYIEIIEKSLVDVNQIQIDFKGITASSSAVLLQGFPTDDSLDILRNRLREGFKNSILKHNIDSRYVISTAHSTLMRFQNKLENPKRLIEVLEKFRDYNFGKFTVEKIELVYNDWYLRNKNTINLCDLYL